MPVPEHPVPPPPRPAHSAVRLPVAITGGAGFVGRYAADYLAARGAVPRLLLRRPDPGLAHETRLVGDLADPAVPLTQALDGADAVLHLAALAHRAMGHGTDELALYRRANCEASVALAQAAADAGVRHFIFVSTAYVHGTGDHDRLISPDDPLAPSGAYAISKAEAEVALADVARERGLALTIVRPTVVYGPAPKANIRALASAVRRGLPLPFAAIANRRSFLALENLASFLAHALAHPPGTGESRQHLVADAEIVSTPTFVRALGEAYDRPARLFPVPPGLLKAALAVAGRGGMAESLIGSFAVDPQAAASSGWAPPLTLAHGLAAMAAADRLPERL